MANDKWMQEMDLKKGALHKQMGIEQDKKIPMAMINQKMKTATGLMKKRLSLAKTFKKIAMKRKKDNDQ